MPVKGCYCPYKKKELCQCNHTTIWHFTGENFLEKPTKNTIVLMDSNVSAVNSPISTSTTELAPRYHIPITLVLIAIPLILWQPWLTLGLSLFGLFLMYQAVSLRLCFTETALDIYRGNDRIRNFPYQHWRTWRIFWLPFPVLFYFREVNSIHFLPMLFEARKLKACLEQYCPQP